MIDSPSGAASYYGERGRLPMPKDPAQNRSDSGTNQNPSTPGTQPDLGTPDKNQNRPANPPPAKGDGSQIPRAENGGPAPATIAVSLPADAKLFVDGKQTQSTSDRRTLISPALEPRKDFHYTLKAELLHNGRTMATSKEVTIRAGQETNVALNFPANDASTK